MQAKLLETGEVLVKVPPSHPAFGRVAQHLRYSKDEQMEILRRMPPDEAAEYAKGILAMLRVRPDLRMREYSAADVSFLEQAAGRQPARYEEGSDEDDGGKSLASMHAVTLNAKLQAGRTVTSDELDRIFDELEETDYVLNYDQDSQRWDVVCPDEPEQYARDRAPKGGVTINGQFYRGGQFLPAEGDRKKPTAASKNRASKDAKREKIRRERGDVDVTNLKQRLADHEEAELSADDVTKARKTFNALKRSHGELTVHRLEDMAEDLFKTLDDLPKGAKAMRAEVSKQLGAISWMIDKAKEGGITGKLDDPDLRDFGANLMKIQDREQKRGTPWVTFLLKGLEQSHGVDPKTSYAQRWENLKQGKYWGKEMDGLLKILKADYGTLTQDQLKELAPNIDLKFMVKDHKPFIPTNTGRITDEVIRKSLPKAKPMASAARVV